VAVSKTAIGSASQDGISNREAKLISVTFTDDRATKADASTNISRYH
jgi:hypothetical protein